MNTKWLRSSMLGVLQSLLLLSFAFSVSAQRLAVTFDDGPQGHSADITSIAFSHDGTKIVTGGEDGQVITWDVTGFPGHRRRNWRFDPYPPRYRPQSRGIFAVFSPDGANILAAEHVQVTMWRAENRVRASGSKPIGWTREYSIGHAKMFKEVDGTLVHDFTRYLEWPSWRSDPIFDRGIIRRPGMSSWFAHFLTLNQVFVLEYWGLSLLGDWEKSDGKPRLLMFDSLPPYSERRELRLFPIPTDVSTNGSLILAVNRYSRNRETAKYAILINSSTGKEILLRSEIDHHVAEVTDAKFSPDGKYVVTVSADMNIRLWQTPTNICLKLFPVFHKDKINSVAFSPEGTRIITGADDGYAALWDLPTFSLTPLNHRPYGRVNLVAYSPDGKSVLTAVGKSAYLWNELPGAAPTPK